jgi:flagellar M-ring protein FliF
MVKHAVGFDAERGDEIEVANVPFKVQPADAIKPLGAPDIKEMIKSPVGLGVAVGALLLVGAVLFFLFKRKKKPAEIETAVEVIEMPTANIAVTSQAVREEMAMAAQKIVLSEDPRKEQLSQIARDYHDATVRIIRAWLQEEGAKARSTAGNSANA